MIECVVKNCHYPVTTFPLDLRLHYEEFKVVDLEMPLCTEHSDLVASIINTNFNRLHEIADAISTV